MLPIKVKLLLVCLVAGLASACNSPMPAMSSMACGVSAQLCASGPAVTRAPVPKTVPQPQPAPLANAAPRRELGPPAEVRTFPVDLAGVLPGAQPGLKVEVEPPPVHETAGASGANGQVGASEPRQDNPAGTADSGGKAAAGSGGAAGGIGVSGVSGVSGGAGVSAGSGAPGGAGVSGVSGVSGTSGGSGVPGVAGASGATVPAAARAPGSAALQDLSGTGQPARQGDAAPPSYRIGLLLPLRSDALRQASEALRAGFLAGWERDKQGVTVTVIETGDAAPDVLASYMDALARQDMIVGPLARSAVSAVANSRKVAKPTIALNYPDNRETVTLPPQMMVIGLSIEDEARQMADWAGREQPGATAYVVGGSVAWQRRSAGAFAAQWQRIGLAAKVVEVSTVNGYLNDGELVALRGRLQTEPGAVVFAALDPDQTRQLRIALAAPPLGEVPIYGTSSLNPGRARQVPGTEMDGVRLLDLPWQLQRDHPAVMVYPQLAPSSERKPDADMERLYALGIDAYRVAREIARQQDQPAARFRLDGVTGQLNVSFGDGAARFERRALQAVYKNGVPVPVPLAVSQQP